MDAAPDEVLYRIMEGVHRCVAAREASLSGIYAAILEEDGRVVRHELVLLGRIYSPKPTIDRWDHGRDFVELVAIMGSVAGRAVIEPVTLTPVSPRIAGYLTPLAAVIVTDSREDES